MSPLPRAGAAANASVYGPVPRLPTRRILVVDDNADAANSLASLLRMHNQDVRTAYGGATALLLYPRFKPDLVIIDLVMPQMDGLMTAAALRELSGPPARILGLTGVGGDALRALSAADDLDGYLTKPVSVQELRQVLQAF